MVKSNIEDRSQVEKAVLQAVKHVKTWTRKELQSLLSKNSAKHDPPLIIELNNSLYLIGNYAINRWDNCWHMIYRYNDDEIVFTSRQAAILYAVCQQSNRYELANLILKNDQDISRLTIKTEQYRLRLEQVNRKNRNNLDLYQSRLVESRCQLRYSQFLLEKNLKLAKYFNL